MGYAKPEEEKMICITVYFTPLVLEKLDVFCRLGLTPNRSEYVRHALMNQITVDWKVFEKMRILEGRD